MVDAVAACHVQQRAKIGQAAPVTVEEGRSLWATANMRRADQ